MAQVTLTNVNKIYPARDRAVHAVKDLNLTVEDGEFVLLEIRDRRAFLVVDDDIYLDQARGDANGWLLVLILRREACRGQQKQAGGSGQRVAAQVFFPLTILAHALR